MIQDLLVLQDRNATVYQLTTEINRLPAEIEKLELKIKEEQKTVEVAQQGVRDLELARKNVELEVETAEEQINKYKNQQLQVKKNDEYRALTHEIELFETKISDLETAELEIMEAIDAARSKLEEVKAEVAKRTAYQQNLIEECREKLENLKSRLGDAETAYGNQCEKMDPAQVSLFEKLTDQIKRAPYVAGVTGQNCGGCHMRVSNDVYKQAKMGELARCDQCGRVLFFES